MKLTEKTKLELYKTILKEKNPFGISNDEEWLDFLSDIWDLQNMPSEDSRFETADQDIWQHTVFNDDWDLDYLFLERLNLLEDDKIYTKFIETIVSPKYRDSEDEILKLVMIINSFIKKEELMLSLFDYTDEDIPIYKVEKVREDRPIDLTSNTIYFNVVQPKQYSHLLSSHKKPKEFPCFILAFNNGWNDYGFKTEFTMFYYDENGDVHRLGELKITDGDEKSTINVIDKKFTVLTTVFCSMGQSIEYYQNLKKIFNRKFESILYALKDAAFFPNIHDKFEQNRIFNTSLIRGNDIERLLRQAKFRIYNYDLKNLYNFKYEFTPKYSQKTIDIEFEFSKKSFANNRIYAIIGKNGVGKTQLITSLPIAIADKKDIFFTPRAPLFSKIIAVSYSSFDDFEQPQESASFNYIYCGLNKKEKQLSTTGLKNRFHSSWKRIKKMERLEQWREILQTFIEEAILDEFIIKKRNSIEVSIDGFRKIQNHLSSGQSISLYVITEIISHIRYDSLLLFDEPETHLHPNAITELINTIYELVEEFQSYCILTTHSPLIVQELFAKNVYIMERLGNIPSIRKIGVETFGENLTILTEEIFGNREIKKLHKRIIDEFVMQGLSYEKIITILENDNIPVNLNLKLYIKSKTN